MNSKWYLLNLFDKNQCISLAKEIYREYYWPNMNFALLDKANGHYC